MTPLQGLIKGRPRTRGWFGLWSGYWSSFQVGVGHILGFVTAASFKGTSLRGCVLPAWAGEDTRVLGILDRQECLSYLGMGIDG